MAAEGDNIVTYIFTGEEERDEDGYYIIPQNLTHLVMHESVTVIPRRLFYQHPNIIEVYCHIGVKRIERETFTECRRLRRLIIPGVEVVEEYAFFSCTAVTDIECPKLERIEEDAFTGCTSLSSINFPSAKIVEGFAFGHCPALTEAKFGKNLETIQHHAFFNCPSLDRIIIPLKNGLIPYDYVDHGTIFQGCTNLKRVDLVEGAVLNETVAALHLEEWRNDMNEEINSISHILPESYAGFYDEDYDNDERGEKALVIREWITLVLRKITRYKAKHHRLLNEATATLQLVLPTDIVINAVVPFLDLPSFAFDGEDVVDG